MFLIALVRAIEIIGEAASKISEETRRTIRSVPGSAIISMRNRLIHAYFDIDHDILWKTVSEEILDVLGDRLRLVERGPAIGGAVLAVQHVAARIVGVAGGDGARNRLELLRA